MRIMALDIGEKNIGVAISDPSKTIARGIAVLRRKNINDDCARIKSLAEEHSVEKIVLGYPLTFGGREGRSAERVRKFKDKMEETVAVPVELCDERCTTISADEILSELGVKNIKKKKQLIDKLAAEIILQSFLNSLKGKK